MALPRPGAGYLHANWNALNALLPRGWDNADAAQALQALGMVALRTAVVEGDGALDAPLLTCQARFAKQMSTSVMLGDPVIHPMQPLETAYRGIILDAGNGAPDDVARRQAIQTEQESFFLMVSQNIGMVPPTPRNDPNPPLLADKLRIMQRDTKFADRFVKAHNAKGGAPDAETVNRLQALAGRAAAAGDSVCDSFRDTRNQMILEGLLPVASTAPTFLATAQGGLVTADARIPAIGAAMNSFTPVSNALRQAGQAIEHLVDGAATTQDLAFIDSFYLFRLLVRYRLESETELSDDDVRVFSSAVTGLLHTCPDGVDGAPIFNWLESYLAWAVIDLEQAVLATSPGNVIFYLKGGRALAYLVGAPATGRNDWDTQVVLNPTLGPREWYQLYNDVRTTIIKKLDGYKRDFLLQVHNNAQQLLDVVVNASAAIDHDRGADAGGDPPPVLAVFARSAKAELIDIGMPRRDTVEGYEQWRMLRGQILHTGGMPHPPPLYFVNDLSMMIRKVLSGDDRSAAKSKKRVTRLAQVLSNWAGGANPVADLAHMATLCPASAHHIAGMGDGPVKFLGIFALEQFIIAYELYTEPPTPDNDPPTFSSCFDAIFAAQYTGENEPLTVWNDELTALYNSLDDQFKPVLYAMGWFAEISTQIEAHLTQRATALQVRNTLLRPNDFHADVVTLARELCSRDVLQRASKSELRIGAIRALGSLLQAIDAADGRDPIAGIEPVYKADMRLYGANRDNDPALVYELLRGIVTDALNTAGLNGTLAIVPNVDPVAGISVRSTAPINFGPGFNYAPVQMLVTQSPRPGYWPLVNPVEGILAASPRDIVLEYREYMGSVDEYGARTRMRKSEEAVIRIMTNYEAPPPSVPPEGGWPV